MYRYYHSIFTRPSQIVCFLEGILPTLWSHSWDNESHRRCQVPHRRCQIMKLKVTSVPVRHLLGSFELSGSILMLLVVIGIPNSVIMIVYVPRYAGLKLLKNFVSKCLNSIHQPCIVLFMFVTLIAAFRL